MGRLGGRRHDLSSESLVADGKGGLEPRFTLNHIITSREEAYKLVQDPAMKVWADKNKNLKEELQNSEEVKKLLGENEINEIFEYDKMLKNVDYIFSRSVDLD